MTPPVAAEAAGSGRSTLAYVIAALAGAAAVYFLIRLLEWDRMNHETPNQEDPFFENPEEPERHD